MKRFIYFISAAALALGAYNSASAQSIYIALGDKEYHIDEQRLNNRLERVGERLEQAMEQVEQAMEHIGEELEKTAERFEKGDYEITISGDNTSRFRGSGRIITESRIVPADYRGVTVSRAIKVTMEERTGTTAVIRADDNVMPHIKIENKGGILQIKIDESIRSINNVTAEVRLPMSTNISALKATSAADINVEYTIKSSELEIDASSAANIRIAKAEVDECDIDASSAASIKASIKATECDIDASSAANVTANLLVKHCQADASSAADISLTGEAGSLDLEASSAANIRAADVRTIVGASASASSGADIKVHAGKSLNANASSGGTVAYKSDHDLNISIKKSSGGNVRKM